MQLLEHESCCSSGSGTPASGKAFGTDTRTCAYSDTGSRDDAHYKEHLERKGGALTGLTRSPASSCVTDGALLLQGIEVVKGKELPMTLARDYDVTMSSRDEKVPPCTSHVGLHHAAELAAPLSSLPQEPTLAAINAAAHDRLLQESAMGTDYKGGHAELSDTRLSHGSADQLDADTFQSNLDTPGHRTELGVNELVMSHTASCHGTQRVLSLVHSAAEATSLKPVASTDLGNSGALQVALAREKKCNIEAEQRITDLLHVVAQLKEDNRLLTEAANGGVATPATVSDSGSRKYVKQLEDRVAELTRHLEALKMEAEAKDERVRLLEKKLADHVLGVATAVSREAALLPKVPSRPASASVGIPDVAVQPNGGGYVPHSFPSGGTVRIKNSYPSPAQSSTALSVALGWNDRGSSESGSCPPPQVGNVTSQKSTGNGRTASTERSSPPPSLAATLAEGSSMIRSGDRPRMATPMKRLGSQLAAPSLSTSQIGRRQSTSTGSRGPPGGSVPSSARKSRPTALNSSLLAGKRPQSVGGCVSHSGPRSARRRESTAPSKPSSARSTRHGSRCVSPAATSSVSRRDSVQRTPRKPSKPQMLHPHAASSTRLGDRAPSICWAGKAQREPTFSSTSFLLSSERAPSASKLSMLALQHSSPPRSTTTMRSNTSTRPRPQISYSAQDDRTTMKGTTTVVVFRSRSRQHGDSAGEGSHSADLDAMNTHPLCIPSTPPA